MNAMIPVLENIGTRWPATERQDCIRLIQSQAGGSYGMQDALREFIPELGRTIGQLLEADPPRLLAWLERRADQMAVAELLEEIRTIQPPSR